MLKPAGVDLQPHVDTIHLAAVEAIRESPDQQTITAGHRAIEAVIEHGSHSAKTQPVVDVARLTGDAFEIIMQQSPAERSQRAHYIAALVADLSRTIDALDTGEDPSSYLAHARSLHGSIPRDDAQDLVEIDLNDRDQLARLIQRSESVQQSSSTPADQGTLRQQVDTFGRYAQSLLESSEEPETLDGLVNALIELQSLAAQSQTEHVSRVVACALRVVESHRSAGEPLPLDAIEFVIACHRIIPMILESMDDPGRVSRAVDALVDQSAFVLMELRRGTRPLGELWPEPDEAEYQAIQNGQDPAGSAQEPHTDAEPDALDGVDYLQDGADWNVDDYRPPSGALHAPGPHTRSLELDRDTIPVPLDQVEQLMELAGELSIRSGGYSQRARRVLSVSQDINSIGDRLRYLVRAWREGTYEPEHVQQHLGEITSDLNLAAADLEHARNDHVAAAERQSVLRARLEQTISELRSMPLKTLVDPLEETIERLGETTGRRVALRTEGASNVVDAVHAEALAGALHELVSNAVEHGIETPDTRTANGKNASGLIRIRARRDGSQTVIQVIDDGAGMDDQKILDRAEAAGYPVPRREMTRDRVLQYIFLPGFTTKTPANGGEIGMGLDFVSEAVSAASGSITVQSEPGRGTAFTIRLPLAAMATSAMVVAISSDRYAIPAAEIEVLDQSEIGAIEETANGYRVRARDETLPAADLGALLGVRSQHHVQSDQGTCLLVTSDDERWVLRVDRVHDSEPVTLEPLNRQYHHLTGVVGQTTLHSGEHALVLDIAQVLDASSRRNRRLSRQTASLSRVPFALVSDDSISVRRQIAGQLEQSGWRVVEARDAFEARELLETVSPDLVVVDLNLPAHGGFQIAQSARNLGDMPIVGLCSREDPELRSRAQSFDIDAILVKPLNEDAFSQIMEPINEGLESEQQQ